MLEPSGGFTLPPTPLPVDTLATFQIEFGPSSWMDFFRAKKCKNLVPQAGLSGLLWVPGVAVGFVWGALGPSSRMNASLGFRPNLAHPRGWTCSRQRCKNCCPSSMMNASLGFWSNPAHPRGWTCSEQRCKNRLRLFPFLYSGDFNDRSGRIDLIDAIAFTRVQNGKI